VRTLEIDLAAYLRANPDLGRHVMIAEANGGILPEVHSSRLIQKKGEVVHLELDATLLMDVTVRQSQGGYSGISFPIGKTGIRYRVGGYRGHSVEVGTQRVPADTGVLVISSQRAVFLGTKKTIELPLSKLINLTLFTDGVQFGGWGMTNGTAAAAILADLIRGGAADDGAALLDPQRGDIVAAPRRSCDRTLRWRRTGSGIDCAAARPM
jgi:hypothetical protein